MLHAYPFCLPVAGTVPILDHIAWTQIALWVALIVVILVLMTLILCRFCRKKSQRNCQDDIFYQNVDPLDATELNSILQNTSQDVLLREKDYPEVESFYNPRDSGISMSGLISDSASVSSHFQLLTNITVPDDYCVDEETRLFTLTPNGSTCYDEFVASLDMGPPLEEDPEDEYMGTPLEEQVEDKASFGRLSILPLPTLAGSEFDITELNDVISCCKNLSESVHVSHTRPRDEFVHGNDIKRSETAIW